MTITEEISEILKWNRYNSLIVLATIAVVFFLNSTLLLAFTSVLSFTYYGYKNRGTLSKLKPLGGYANWVTVFRLLLLLIAMIHWDDITNVVFVGILIIFVCLDGLDGWVARKTNQATVFGQYFDMELDALFVLFCCIVLCFKGSSGLWVLIPGGLRYLFVIYTWILGPKEQKEDRTSYGATIAVAFFISLLISFVFQNAFQNILLKVSGCLIVVSFGISFYKYSRI